MTTTQKTKRFSRTFVIRAGFVILLLLAGGGGYYYYSRIHSQNAARSTNGNSLQTAKATVGNLVLFASGTGTIMPAAETSFGFNTSGQVSQINVKVGDHVEAGQVLAQLDNAYANIALAQAQEAMDQLTSAAAIATAQQTLADDQTSFATAKENLSFLISPEVLFWEEKVAEREQTLTEAQTAAQTNSSDTAKQKVSEAETSLQYAQNSLKYFQTVYEETYVPKNFSQYQTVRTRHGPKTKVATVTDEATGVTSDVIYAPTEGEIGMAARSL